MIIKQSLVSIAGGKALFLFPASKSCYYLKFVPRKGAESVTFHS